MFLRSVASSLMLFVCGAARPSVGYAVLLVWPPRRVARCRDCAVRVRRRMQVRSHVVACLHQPRTPLTRGHERYGTLATHDSSAVPRPVAVHRSQSEPVDPKPIIEKECHQPCVALWTEYLACGERIKGKAEATCQPQYFDYWKCVDKCVRGRRRGRGAKWGFQAARAPHGFLRAPSNTHRLPRRCSQS